MKLLQGSGPAEWTAPKGHRTATNVRNHALSLAEDALDQLGRISRGELDATASEMNAMSNAAGKILDIAYGRKGVPDEDPFDGLSEEESETLAQQALQTMREKRERELNEQAQKAPR